MTLFLIRAASGLGFATLLAACGAGTPADLPVRSAGMVQTNVNAATQVASANMPAPDCAADGCKGLRIIDANAESFRYAAMQRAARPQS